MKSDFYTKEDLEKAKNVSALDYAMEHNYPLIKTGKYYKHRDHDSMVFDDKGRWHWNSQGLKSQSAIDLLMEFENMSYVSAIKTLAGNLHHYESVANTNRTVDKEPKPFELPEKNSSQKRMFAYLSKTRHLDYMILNHLYKNGLLYESKDYGNAVFVQKDLVNNPKGATYRSTNTFLHKPIIGLVKGSSKAESAFYFGNTKTFKNLIVTESAIDAISLASMWKNSLERTDLEKYKSSVFIATGGNGHEFILKFADKYKEQIEKVLLCQDNDDPGNKLANRIKEDIATKFELPCERFTPDNKDFNDDLVAIQENIDNVKKNIDMVLEM